MCARTACECFGECFDKFTCWACVNAMEKSHSGEPEGAGLYAV